MKLRNDTPFPHQIFLWPDSEGREFCSILVKVTCVLSTGQLAPEQRRMELSDTFSEAGAVVAPADMVPRRTGTSVVLRGSICAPHSQPSGVVHASVAVGPLVRRIVAYGERRWIKTQGRVSASMPTAFVSVPATLEHAFGGRDGGESFAPNPIGIGFVSDQAAAEGVQLPRLEDPHAQMQSPMDRPAPASLDATPATFAPRRARAGTYDEAWKRSRAPLLPDDFDERYFDVAPDALVARPFLVGRERIELEGLHPAGLIRTRVPRVPVRIDVGNSRAMSRLDLIVIEPDTDRITLTFRRTYDVSSVGLSFPKVAILLLQRFPREAAEPR